MVVPFQARPWCGTVEHRNSSGKERVDGDSAWSGRQVAAGVPETARPRCPRVWRATSRRALLTRRRWRSAVLDKRLVGAA